MNEYWSWNILSIGALCVLLAGIFIPQILLIAYRKKLFDTNDERKIHHGNIPRLGGIAFVPVICLSIAMVVGWNAIFGCNTLGATIVESSLTFLMLFCGLQIMYITGLADDLVGIRYRAKFGAQIVSSLLLLLGGLWFNDFWGILGIYDLPQWFGIPFTLVVMVFLINAVNLIDGLDGLASGLSSIACLVFGITFFLLGSYVWAVLAFATLGVLVPFFFYNVFGNEERHSKIFMGDTGSLTIGLLLVAMGIRLFDSAPLYPGAFKPMVLAFSPLIVPCFDCVRVYIWRLRHHHPPFTPDKNHIHHRMLATGLSHKVTMTIIVLSSAVFTGMNLGLSMVMNINLIILLDIVIWGGLMVFINRKRKPEFVD